MLKIESLENVRVVNGKLIAACPACRAMGQDGNGDHLSIFVGDDGTFENGKYNCVVHSGDRDHNKQIFALVGLANKQQPFDKKRRKEYTIQKKQREQVERKKLLLTNYLISSLDELVAPYLSDSWRKELIDRSPIHIDRIESIPHEFIKCMFPMDAIVWMGYDIYDSGKERHRANFKPASEWLKQKILPKRIAPAHFREGSFKRSKDNVIESPFIIIECDDIIGKEPHEDSEKESNKQLNAALGLYAEDKLGLNLRAVIDTGNKSLHLWFDRPPPEALETIEKMVAGLRIDSSVFNHSETPVRMPHCIHHKTNKSAQLLYLNPLTK